MLSYKLILQEFAKLYYQTLIELAKSYKNTKVNKDTLSDSDIVKDTLKNFKVSDTSLVLTIANYYIYIENGREKGTKRIPLSAIIQWLKKKNIAMKNKSKNYRGQTPSINKLAFAIQNAIFRDGIKGRPIWSEALLLTASELDHLLDETLNKFVDKLLLNILNPGDKLGTSISSNTKI